MHHRPHQVNTSAYIKMVFKRRAFGGLHAMSSAKQEGRCASEY